MKKLILCALVACSTMPALAAYYIAGDFNSWNAAGLEMTETSTGSGIYTATIQAAAGRHEFKITVGDWSTNWPAANSWAVINDTGAVTVTFNTNTVEDGWLTKQYRIGLDYVPDLTWSVAGGFNGWNNNDAATVMTNLGGGIYYYEMNLAAGEQKFKAVVKGSSTWDSISTDARSVGTADIVMNLDTATKVGLWVNTIDGTVKYGAVPEPATMIALGAGLGALALRRRKKA